MALVAVLVPGPGPRADLRYKAEIVGVDNDDLSSLLNKVSDLKTLEDRPPVSAEALRRRAEKDLGRLADAAHSLGYWDAHFSYTIDTGEKPAKVTVKAAQGPRYHVAAVHLLGPEGRPLNLPPGTAPLPLKPGDPAETAPVVSAEDAAVAAFTDHGHPFAKAEKRRVVIDNNAHTMDVTYRIDPGPAKRFGSTKISGLEHLAPGYVERRVQWQQSAPYDARKLAETRQKLLRSGLFSTVDLKPVPDPQRPGEVLIAVDATERARRTIGAGVGYNTSQGAGARAFWENRDLFGNAENLRLSAQVGQQTDDFTVKFRRPDVLSVDQDLLATAEISNETPVAYNSRRALASAGLERRFGPLVTGGIGLEFVQANVEALALSDTLTSAQRTQRYTLAGIPAYLKLDTTDNLLNPTRGTRAQLSVTPAHTFSTPELNFVTNLLSASHYWKVGRSDRAVVAARVAFGSLDGAPLAALPADQRIYVGGGGSLRPYGYQMAGPLDQNGIPIGGKSSLVMNLEARIKITPSIGIVPFVDAGSYYETSLPQLGHTLLYGVGIGLRYYTNFGPLRLDLATPLRRRSADSPIQVYISLGEAF